MENTEEKIAVEVVPYGHLIADQVDIEKYLSPEDQNTLHQLHDYISARRVEDGKPDTQCVIFTEEHPNYAVALSLVEKDYQERPAIVMPENLWYTVVQNLILMPRLGVTHNRHDSDMEAVAVVSEIRSKPGAVIDQLIRILETHFLPRLETAFLRDSNRLNAWVHTQIGSDEARAEHAMQEANRFEQGESRTIAAVQAAIDRLVDTRAHLNRVTNTIELIKQPIK
ncbi:hypothetical protein AVP3_0055 [Aeromonas phage AVP3]